MPTIHGPATTGQHAGRAPSPRWRVSGLLAVAAAIVLVLGLHIIDPQPGHDGAYWPWPLGTMAFPVVAALLLIKRPGNAIGRTVGVVSLAVGVVFLGHWLTVRDLDAVWSLPAELAGEGAAYVQFGGMVALLFLYPSGRTLGGWHARALTVWCAVMGTVAVLALVVAHPLTLTGRDNPIGIVPVAVFEVAQAALLPVAVLGFASLVVRWRRSVGLERLQLRWFGAAAAVMLVTLFVVTTVGDDGPATPLWDAVLGVVIAAGLYWSLPAAIAVAVLRYRLYDIDRLISRTVAYLVVAGVIVGVYAAGVLGLQALLPASGEVGVAAATLAVAALFQPLRRRVQREVDRRFNRARYRTEEVLATFAVRLRDQVAVEPLVRDVIEVVDDALKPVTATLWVAGPPASAARRT